LSKIYIWYKSFKIIVFSCVIDEPKLLFYATRSSLSMVIAILELYHPIIDFKPWLF